MIHTRTTSVVFHSPFNLAGLDRVYPPGVYEVVTDDEQLDLSFTAYRRIDTRIRLPSGAETIYWSITPVALEAALAHDRKIQVA